MNEQWRLLEIGETRVSGDGYWNITSHDWESVEPPQLGTPIEHAHTPHRRKIESGWREIKDGEVVCYPCVFWGTNGAGMMSSRVGPCPNWATHWTAVPVPLPERERLSDEEKAWREYCEDFNIVGYEKSLKDSFLAGFKAAKGAK